MSKDEFPQEVVEALGCYVYRLIDPRNGETFYVGRGRGQRVFAHVKGLCRRWGPKRRRPETGANQRDTGNGNGRGARHS